MYSLSGIATISASLSSSRDLLFQLFANLGSFFAIAGAGCTACTAGWKAPKLAFAALEAKTMGAGLDSGPREREERALGASELARPPLLKVETLTEGVGTGRLIGVVVLDSCMGDGERLEADLSTVVVVTDVAFNGVAFADFKGGADLGATGATALGFTAALAFFCLESTWMGWLLGKSVRGALTPDAAFTGVFLMVFFAGAEVDGEALVSALGFTGALALVAAAFLAVTTFDTMAFVTDFADLRSWLTATTFFLACAVGDLLATTGVWRGATTRPFLIGAVAALFLLVTILIVA